jgi:hypothetical protein
MPRMSDDDIQLLETQFPAASSQVFAAASQRALMSGQSVLHTEGEFIVRIYPDGRKEPVKKVEPAVPVVRGSVHTIR